MVIFFAIGSPMDLTLKHLRIPLILILAFTTTPSQTMAAAASICLADHERKSSQQTMLPRYELRPVDPNSSPRTTLEVITGIPITQKLSDQQSFFEAMPSSTESTLLRNYQSFFTNCRKSKLSILTYAINHPDIRPRFIPTFIDHLQDDGLFSEIIDYQDREGRTSLISLTLNLKSLVSDWERKFHGAAYKKNRIDQTLQAINKLLTLGASPNITDNTQTTPLGHLIDFRYKQGRRLFTPAIQAFTEHSSNKTIEHTFSKTLSTMAFLSTFKPSYHSLGFGQLHELLEVGNIDTILSTMTKQNKFFSFLTAVRDYRASWKKTTDLKAIDKECTELIIKFKKKHLLLSNAQITCTESNHQTYHTPDHHRKWFGKDLEGGSSEENVLICKFLYSQLISGPIAAYYQTQLNKHFNDVNYRLPTEIMDLTTSFITVNP